MVEPDYRDFMRASLSVRSMVDGIVPKDPKQDSQNSSESGESWVQICETAWRYRGDGLTVRRKSLFFCGLWRGGRDSYNLATAESWRGLN